MVSWPETVVSFPVGNSPPQVRRVRGHSPRHPVHWTLLLSNLTHDALVVDGVEIARCPEREFRRRCQRPASCSGPRHPGTETAAAAGLRILLVLERRRCSAGRSAAQRIGW